MDRQNGSKEWAQRLWRNAKLLSKSSSVPVPPPCLCLRLSLEDFKLCSLFQMCPNVLDSAWDGFLLPKGVSSVCTRHSPRNAEVTAPMEWPELILAMTLPWFWVVRQDWAQRALFFQCLSLAKETAPRETQELGRQGSRTGGVNERPATVIMIINKYRVISISLAHPIH